MFFPHKANQNCSERQDHFRSLGCGDTHIFICPLGPHCRGHVCHRGLTEEEKQVILDKHNEYRALAADGGLPAKDGEELTPPGTIGPLEWDEDLAIEAQM